MTKILHTSDLHGNYQLLIEILDSVDFDIWVDSGDFFPNSTRGDSAIENRFQDDWLRQISLPEKLRNLLSGRPVIVVPGNHDYIDLSSRLQEDGCTSHNLCHGSVTIDGIRFAGFREIPYIRGEWAGEVYNESFDEIVDKLIEKDPNVVVTHAPGRGILSVDSYGSNHGIRQLSNAIQWKLQNVQAHLFGHVHGSGGRKTVLGDITFSNAATYFNIVEV